MSGLPSQLACWLLAAAASTVALVTSIVVNRVFSIGLVSDDAAYFAYTIQAMREGGAAPYVDFFALHGPIYFWIGELAGHLGSAAVVTPVMGLIIVLFLLIMVARCAIGMTVRAATSYVAPPVADPDAPPPPAPAPAQSDGDAAASVGCGCGRAGPVRFDPGLLIRWPVLFAVGLLATSLVVGWGHLVAFVPSGGRPKFLAIGFILAAALALSRRKLVLGGAVIGLACWTWQVAVFAGSALLLFWVIRHTFIRREPLADGSRRLVRHWRRTDFPWRGIVRIAGGAVGVSVIAVVILAAQGRLQAFIEHAVVFPLVYQIGPWEARDLPDIPTGLRPLVPWGLLTKYLSTSSPGILVLVGVGLAGAIWVSVRRFRQREIGPEVGLRWYVLGIVLGQHVQSAIVSHGPGYVVAMLAPLAALAGWIVTMAFARPLAHRARRAGPWVVVAITVAMAALFFINGRRPPDDAAIWQDRLTQATSIVAIARGGQPAAALDADADADVGDPPVDALISPWALIDPSRPGQTGHGSSRPPSPSEASVLIVGEPILRAILGGAPREFDVQWVYGRGAWLEARWPGGIAGWVDTLFDADPRVVVLSERTEEIDRVLLERLHQRGYVPSATVMWEGRPVWLRADVAAAHAVDTAVAAP